VTTIEIVKPGLLFFLSFFLSWIITWTIVSDEERHAYYSWRHPLMRIHLEYHPMTITWIGKQDRDRWVRLIVLFFFLSLLRCLIIVLCRAKEGYEAELCDSQNEITNWLRASSSLYLSSSLLSSIDRQERIHARSVLSTTAWMSKSCDIRSSISIYTLEWERKRDR
jgi:hypothetical protein